MFRVWNEDETKDLALLINIVLTKINTETILADMKNCWIHKTFG